MSNFQLIPANAFTIGELTDIYNQTRIDYIVPMPMNVARLQEYIQNYDLDVSRSVVAMVGGKALGLAMLGVRPDHTWITRLGVVPGKRHYGTGEALMRYEIQQSWALNVADIILEVIINNVPAHRLFRKLGFRETRDLLILRRPPGAPDETPGSYKMIAIDDPDQVRALLRKRNSVPSWLDDYPSLCNAGHMHAIQVRLSTGEWGWIAFQKTIFQLGRIVIQTEIGDPYKVGRALVHALHMNNPLTDTKTENLTKLDEHLQAFLDTQYLESFARIEMRLENPQRNSV